MEIEIQIERKEYTDTVIPHLMKVEYSVDGSKKQQVFPCAAEMTDEDLKQVITVDEIALGRKEIKP